MECALVLSSVSPWEYVLKEQGVRKASGFACKFCEGFWKAKAGSSRVVQLYGRWIQDRMAYYLRMEPMGASRDEALDLDYPVQERIRFSVQNGLGRVSDLIWSVLLSNPEREGLLKIQQLAAKRVGSQ